jgi:hypothetical protein
MQQYYILGRKARLAARLPAYGRQADIKTDKKVYLDLTSGLREKFMC